MAKLDTTKYQKELFELLAIPSISAQSTHKADMKKACKWLQSRLTSLGFTTKILATAGHPVVYADNLKAGQDKPTLLIYGHYDVQSPDPLNLWKSDPFKALVKNGNIYARGVADDKGQLYTWIAAIDEVLQKNGDLPANIKFLIEGEEEVGSKNLASCINKNKNLLKADICLISDTHCLSETKPMIDYGLRGIVYEDVTLTTLDKDVHSGVYGGNVLNPIQVLAEIISKLKTKEHKIVIPGFYDNVRKLSKKERARLAKLPFRETQVKEETGAVYISGESGFSVHERAGARPTVELNGIWGGYQGEGPKTIIPAEAHAKISMRLVPNQTPKDIHAKFVKHIKTLVPKGAKIEVNLISTAEPALMQVDGKYFKLAEKAYKKVFGNVPVYELSGGTIGAVADVKNVLGIDSITMGYGLPDDGLHAPNEKLSLAMFTKGIATNIEFLKSLV